ncbi:hypothetical protein ES703_78417 [subsurface metagenome]
MVAGLIVGGRVICCAFRGESLTARCGDRIKAMERK